MGVFFQSIIMGASVLPVAIFTAIWGVVGVLLPVLVPRSPHKSVIQVLISKFTFFSINCVISGLSDHHCILLLAVLALLLHVPGHILFLPDENFFSMCSMMFYPVCRWTPWLARSLRRKRFTRWSSSGTVARTISRQHWSWTVFSKMAFSDLGVSF